MKNMNNLSKLQFLIIPSLNCPAGCKYCFGPNKGDVMSFDMLDKTLGFIKKTVSETKQKKIRVTLHGGEPLMAGHEFYEKLLSGFNSRFNGFDTEIGIQSNLWLLDDYFCKLFKEHKVNLGTSLDGPEDLTDSQRGTGYFDRTMNGIKKARSFGLNVGCISTFTSQSVKRWREVFDFFINEKIDFSIHAAVSNIHFSSIYALQPEQYGSLLCDMLDYYVKNRRKIIVASLDHLCKGAGFLEGRVCTFKKCLGMFLAVDPSGNIYNCQRFAGNEAYRLGSIEEDCGIGQLFSGQGAKRFIEYQHEVDNICKDCEHFSYCKGGCPYNAWADRHSGKNRDPYCKAYKKIYSRIRSRLFEEMSASENIEAIVEKPYRDSRSLFKKGPLIDLIKDGPHPSQISQSAKRILAAYELAKCGNINRAALRLKEMGISNHSTEFLQKYLMHLNEHLRPGNRALNKIYIHVTFRCQLSCSHCYAQADGTGKNQKDMSPESIEKLIYQAIESGFKEIVITGGEPLAHDDVKTLLRRLISIGKPSKQAGLVLRTNLALPLGKDDLLLLAEAFDEMVVSIDGDKTTHEKRRGKGTYRKTVNNLAQYLEITRRLSGSAKVSITAVLNTQDVCGHPGISVRQLADNLGIRHVKFRPMLPLGRATSCGELPGSHSLGAYLEPEEIIENGIFPTSTCGIGQNLYVEPSGDTFPCYACRQTNAFLGNAIHNGLGRILNSDSFCNLTKHTVDTNKKCKNCDMRYLCGGACRAWGNEENGIDLDAPIENCYVLKRRALKVLEVAKNYLED